MAKNIDSRIVGLIADGLPPGRERSLVTADASLYFDLGFDSLALAALAFRIEEELGVEFHLLAERVAQFRTVHDVVTIVAALVPEQ